MSLLRKKKVAKLFKLQNNRYTSHKFINRAEGTIKIKGQDFLTVPNHGIINEENGQVLYFVNDDDNRTFNPNTIKKDADMFSKAVVNFNKLYETLVSDVRDSQGDLEPEKEIKIFKKLRQSIYDFKIHDTIESDNIRAPPSAQQAIMSDDVVKGLARTESLPPLYSACLIGVGIAIGLIIGAWILGDTYNQQDYIQNDNYYSDKDNSTIVIAMIQLPEFDYNGYEETISFLSDNGKNIISSVLIIDGFKRMLIP